MGMRITSRHRGGVLVLDFEGQVLFTGDEIQKAVSQHWEEGERLFLLNMTTVPYIDSLALGDIVRTRARVIDQGGRFGLFAVQHRVMELLDIVRLTDVLVVSDTEEAGVQLLQTAQAT